MVNKIFLALLLFGLILLSGCLKTKTVEECDKIKDETIYDQLRAGELASCYHEVAVGDALHNDTGAALDACEHIGASSVFSQSELNNCYSDIAGILKNQTICEKIETSLLEEPTTFAGLIKSYKEQCIAKATPPKKADVCGVMVFILAPLFALFFSLWKK